MGTTPTYSWPYPDDTDPVANGAQDIEDLALAVETTVSGLDQGGLVFISRTTVGSAVSSVTVSGAFSSTYDNYRVLLHGIVPSTNAGLTIRFGAVASGYKFAGWLANYAGTSSGIGTASGTEIRLAAVDPTDLEGISVDIYGPNLADKTNTTSLANYGAGGTSGGVTMYAGIEPGSTQHTAFSIQLTSGTMTGGTIDLYGYRKA